MSLCPFQTSRILHIKQIIQWKIWSVEIQFLIRSRQVLHMTGQHSCQYIKNCLRTNWNFLWWRHQMETFFALQALCAENSPVSGEFPAQSQWRGALVFSLICAWINGRVNNGQAGDLRRHCTHNDVTLMHWIWTVLWKVSLSYIFCTLVYWTDSIGNGFELKPGLIRRCWQCFIHSSDTANITWVYSPTKHWSLGRFYKHGYFK